MDTERYSKIPAKNYKKLPDHPNLEHLKQQAKDLLAAFKTGDLKAEKRVRRFISPEQITRGLRLKDAQEVVAREYTTGPYKIPSWKVLTRYVDAVTHLTPESLQKWLEASVSNDWEQRDIANRVITTKGSDDQWNSVYFAGLHHADPRIREQCLGRLDHSDIPVDAPFMAALQKAARDSNPRVRRAAIHTMFCQRCKSATPQVDLDLLAEVSLHDESPRTRKVALYGLGRNPNRAAAIAAVKRHAAQTTDPEATARAQLYLAELANARNPKFRP